MVHAFETSTQEGGRGRWISVSSRRAWSTRASSRTGSTSFPITSLIAVGDRNRSPVRSTCAWAHTNQACASFPGCPGPGFMYITVSLMVGLSFYFLLELQNTLSSLEPSSSQSHAHCHGREHLFFQGPNVFQSHLLGLVRRMS